MKALIKKTIVLTIIGATIRGIYKLTKRVNYLDYYTRENFNNLSDYLEEHFIQNRWNNMSESILINSKGPKVG